MIIGSRYGHSENCRGAKGLRDEVDAMKPLHFEFKKIMEQYGHTIIDCCSNANTQNGELSEGARKANAQILDLFISWHGNIGGGQGCEAWIANNSRAKPYAERMCKNFSSLGFKNRGVKYSDKYYEMRNINAPNIIFETLFLDSEKDISIWSPTPYEVMARYLANAIDPNIPIEKEQDYYRVCVQRFTNKEDAEKAKQRISSELGYYCFTEKI